MPPRKRTPKNYPADELKTISSMGTRLDDMQTRNQRDMRDLNTKIGGTANRLRYDTARGAIEVRRAGEVDQVKEVTKSVTKILDKLGLTIAALSKGIVQMTAATAVATKEAIQDYGRAISEDIRVNKANFVAMSLSQASPLFGYFVGKLFETQIFRSALEKIRGKASQLYAGLLDRFRRSREKAEEEAFFEEGQPVIGGAPARKARAAVRRARRVVGGAGAVGGRAAGRARARVAGEGGAAGEEAIASMREATISSSEDIINAIRETSKIQVAEYRKHFNYFVKVFTGKVENSLIFQIHKELSLLRTAMVTEEEAQVSLTETLQGLLGEGKLGTMFKFFTSMYKIVLAPIKWLFSIRGGYRADLPKTGNIFKNIFDTLALIYTKGMVKLDIISNYLLQIGESLRKVTGAGPMETAKEEGLYTYFGKIKDWMKERKKPREEREKKSLKERVLDFLVDQYDLDRAAMEEAISMIPAKYKEKGAKVFQKAEETRDKIVDSLAGIFINTKEAVEGDKDKEKKDEDKDKKSLKQKIIDKVLDAKEKALDEVKKKKGLWDLIKTGAMFLFGLLKTVLGPILNPLKMLLGPVGRMAGRGLMGLGKAGLRVGGAAYGGYELLKGGIEGAGLAGTWHGKKPGEKVSTSETITAAIGGALGGTEGGVKGAFSGAAKGAALGSMIAPGIGTVIGGIAGAILGVIGGENIAKGLQYVWDGVKKLAGAILDFVMFPFKLASEVAGKAKDWILEEIEKIPVIGPSLVKAIKVAGKVIQYGTPVGLAYTAIKAMSKSAEEKGGVSAEEKRLLPKSGTYIGGELVEPGKPLSARQQKLQEISAQMGNAPEGMPGISAKPGVDLQGLKPSVYDKFLSMGEEYQKKSGQGIVVNSAFRTRAEQAQLYATNPNAAPPGHSKHELGTAIDVQSFNAGQLDSMGLLDKYGFNRPVPGEPWHLQSEVGDVFDRTFRRMPITRKDMIGLGIDRETIMAKALLDSSENLQSAIGSGLSEVSKGMASNATTISNTIISNSQTIGSGRGARGGETDSDLAAVMSGNLT